MQNRGVIPLFISASRLGPNLCLYYPGGFKANFHLLAPASVLHPPTPELRIPPPWASVPVWADLHTATMRVAGAVASRRWDRPVCSGYRRMWPSGGKEQHLRSLAPPPPPPPPGLATPPKDSRCTAIWTLTLFLHSHKWANSRKRSKKTFTHELWEEGGASELTCSAALPVWKLRSLIFSLHILITSI